MYVVLSFCERPDSKEGAKMVCRSVQGGSKRAALLTLVGFEALREPFDSEQLISITSGILEGSIRY